ncbi:Auxin-responsive protein IAA3 [Capsicum annuum]|uniref:Auxin-responsive protein n=1 Tax=Capsicum annuum TaxID=4072 RepID=A0A2G2ZKX0_CAPAN|nr:Auxin-responsive protein IAA3 [Capsicum annuum]KAF3677798.1 Auxin-responsive protein IAA3 [Capsicum annuum]PHT82629.1 Auxin-responsive protein IAA3 [Capsicum annuum]
MEKDLNLKATELRLGVPGCDHKQIVSNSKNNKRALPKYEDDEATISHVAKTQIVRWPPVRSYRKSTLQTTTKILEAHEDQCGIYVKISMDGAPFLRTIDLKMLQ